MIVARLLLLSRYAPAVLLTLAAAGVSFEFRRFVEPNTLLPFFAAVILSLWLAGFGPALLATGLSGAIFLYHDIVPAQTFEVVHVSGYIRLFGFLVISLLLINVTRRARDAAELHRQTEQKLGLLVEASGTLRRSLQLSEVLPAVLDLSRRVIAADAYAVWRQSHDGSWRMVSALGLSENYQSDIIRSAGSSTEVLEGPFVFEDVEQAPLLAARRERYRAEGIRALLAVPLRMHGENSGTISFYCRTAHRFREPEIRVACALANLAASAIATAELYEEQTRLRAEAQEAEWRSRFLAEVGAALASSLDFETTLASVARLAVPHLADWCAVDVFDEDGAIRRLAIVHVDPAKVKWADELGRRYPPDPNAPHGPPYVLRSGQPELFAEISDEMLVRSARDAEHLRILREVGLKAYVCVPLIARGRTLGAISFISAESGRRYSEADLAWAQQLCRHAALAADNARLYSIAQQERTEAQEAASALRISEARLAGILGVSEDAIICADEQQRITLFSPGAEKMFGYRASEAIGRPLEILLPKDWATAQAEQAPSLTPLDAIRAMNERGALFGHRTDGSVFPAEASLSEFELSGEKVLTVRLRDITERKQFEEQLRQTQKLESVGLLAGGIAHDFNNLLTGILGNASLALDTLSPSNPASPLLDNVLHASERAADLTRQLLAYSGKGRFVIQRLNLSDLVREISHLVHTSMPKNVQLRLDLAAGLPPVEADSSQIQQLIMNLVINAAEAIGDEYGTVLVTTGRQEIDADFIRDAFPSEKLVPGMYVFLEVHDTGAGMDEKTKTRIFDPFFTTKFMGRGLGLAAALGIVRTHQGAINVYSTPGRGSTFKVLLPAAQGEGVAPRPAAESADLRGAGTVLVVDDEEVVRGATRSALERYGYGVLLAENGRQAVDIFRRQPDRVALVLLDMTMAVMSGEETLRLLKAIRPDVPVIVSSGYNEVEAIQRFAGKGMTAFLQKPYTATQLAAKVKLVLQPEVRGVSEAGA